jgi:hypothetical protein
VVKTRNPIAKAAKAIMSIFLRMEPEEVKSIVYRAIHVDTQIAR